MHRLHSKSVCVTARRDTIVRTRLSRLVLLAAIGSPIGRQFPYVDMDWSIFCVVEAISRPISNRSNRVASEISGRHDVHFWKVRPLVGIVAHVSVYVAILDGIILYKVSRIFHHVFLSTQKR